MRSAKTARKPQNGSPGWRVQLDFLRERLKFWTRVAQEVGISYSTLNSWLNTPDREPREEHISKIRSAALRHGWLTGEAKRGALEPLSLDPSTSEAVNASRTAQPTRESHGLLRWIRGLAEDESDMRRTQLIAVSFVLLVVVAVGLKLYGFPGASLRNAAGQGSSTGPAAPRQPELKPRVAAAVPEAQPKLYPMGIQKDGVTKIGFRDAEAGIWAIEPQYEGARSFQEGLAAAKLKGKWGFINVKGEWVIAPKFDWTMDFVDGLVLVNLGGTPNTRASVDGGKYGFVDRTGRFVIPPKFDAAGWSFNEGLAQVSLDGKWGYIDRTGNFVITPQFAWADQFQDGYAWVNLGGKPLSPVGVGFSGGKFGFVNRSGKLVVEVRFAGVKRFSGGLAPAVLKETSWNSNGGWGYIDPTGTWVIPPKFDDADEFSQGLAAVRVGTLWGFINPSGSIVIEPAFECAGRFTEGRARVQKKGVIGYVDISGTPTAVPAPDYDNPLAHWTSC